MVARKKETAEQKLLKMIEASQSEGGVAVKQKRKTRKKQDALSFIKFFNLLLTLGVIVVIGLLGYELKNGMALVGQPVRFADKMDFSRRGMGSSDMLNVTQKLPYYLASVHQRNFFVPYEEQTKQTAKVDTITDLARKTKGLRLVGISWLETPQSASAMIEDTGKKTTYFLQKGESVNDVEVKTIYADSVELSYQNEEMMLRYDKPQL